MQEVSLGCRGWPKKLKLAMEEGAGASSAVEDGFSSPNNSCSVVVDDGLSNLGFDNDGDKEQNPIARIFGQEWV